jgi:hypothetical protein
MEQASPAWSDQRATCANLVGSVLYGSHRHHDHRLGADPDKVSYGNAPLGAVLMGFREK